MDWSGQAKNSSWLQNRLPAMFSQCDSPRRSDRIAQNARPFDFRYIARFHSGRRRPRMMCSKKCEHYSAEKRFLSPLFAPLRFILCTCITARNARSGRERKRNRIRCWHGSGAGIPGGVRDGSPISGHSKEPNRQRTSRRPEIAQSPESLSSRILFPRVDIEETCAA